MSRSAPLTPASPVTQGTSAVMPVSYGKLGEKAFERIEKIPAEFLSITYGSLVRQMLTDCSDSVEQLNLQLEAMGNRIGVRLIEEFVARSGVPNCRHFSQTGEAVAKVGLKMFLGINGTVENTGADSYSVTFDDNPLNLFVDLPEGLRGSIWYSNILCGVIRGSLGQVGLQTEVKFYKDTLRGDDVNEIRVRLKGRDKEQFKVEQQ
jgi:hypothetical protein